MLGKEGERLRILKLKEKGLQRSRVVFTNNRELIGYDLPHFNSFKIGLQQKVWYFDFCPNIVKIKWVMGIGVWETVPYDCLT